MSVWTRLSRLSNGQLLLILVGGVVILGASFQVIEARPEFCKSCHEMEFYYDTWTSSTHVDDADCLRCHTEPGVGGFIDAKIRGVTELIAHITGGYEVPIQPGVRVKNPQCLKCHPDAYNIVDTTVEARHDLHMEADILCVDCHSRVVHAAVGEPKVIPANQCDDCHDSHVEFPLLGGHANMRCGDCHEVNSYSGLSPDCESCHDLPEPHMPFDVQACIDCHTLSGWSPATFDHSSYPLTGAHESVLCSLCHTSGVYAGTPSECVDCHAEPLYHVGLSQDCTLCHTTGAFVPSTYLHPLIEEHYPWGEKRLDCEGCHRTTYSSYSCTGSGCHRTNNPEEDDDD